MAQRTPLVHVIVVSHNGRAAVSRCLRSVFASTYPNVRVIVVDNASEDGTVDVLRGLAGACSVVANASNLGFGDGCNVGLESAVAEGTDYALLLNQDAWIDPALLETLVAFMTGHPRAGIVGPKTYSSTPTAEGAPRRLYAGAWRTFLPLIQNIPGIERADATDPDRPIETDYVWGHGMMIRAETLGEVGLFDPAFFLYCEDIDLCRRVKKAGYEIWCEPRASMWHDIPDGARADRSEPWRWAHKVRSTRLFHRKHYSRAASGALTLLTVLVEAKRLVQRRRLPAARHLLRAYAASLVGRGIAHGETPR